MTEISLIEPNDVKADLFIGCVGYEHRSLEALRKIHNADLDPAMILFDYQSGDLFSYPENRADLIVQNATLVANFGEFMEKVEAYLNASVSASILFDVTSFDREKIAVILQTFFGKRSHIGAVSICYFPRTFVEPSHSLDIVRSFGPVIPAFIGETSSSRDSLALLIGAGYEYGRAVGAIDLLEPDRIYCMTPIGTDSRFEDAIEKNNLGFSFLENEELLQKYDLSRPENLFYEIRRIVEFEVQERNVLILPLGPKLFAAAAMLVAFILHPSVMVWRHSTASKDAPKSTSDAHASGVDVRLAFRFVS
ncbi:hypothetical protein [Pseudosulfitobacter sp. DSM 107133]|uniref:hypothetical protein n=1 Tax=Pseudosulfitobacter sp. DSM 107133 TaxID=2883100 RepID=UPI0013B409B0|nr:hypothetical protein [Pseudosulfitobacter sp. DSM 107133]UOA27127.1 hypothetical protein DSM107133_01838 [Pseudosulfitobacter sp. DSM 107133]